MVWPWEQLTRITEASASLQILRRCLGRGRFLRHCCFFTPLLGHESSVAHPCTVGASAPSPQFGGERRGQSPSPTTPSEMSQDPAHAGSDFLCDQAEMVSIRPEDFKDMVRAGAMAASARGRLYDAEL